MSDRAPIEHELKTWPEYFKEVIAGRKPFEVRANDRDFQEGDTLWLREWNPRRDIDGNIWPKTGTYTGREIRVRVGYILGGECAPEGVTVMAIAKPTGAASAERSGGEGDRMIANIRQDVQSIANCLVSHREGSDVWKVRNLAIQVVGDIDRFIDLRDRRAREGEAV